MSKPILKTQILIGNKLLGSLLYFKDKADRDALKFSFKNKVGGITLWTDSPLLKNSIGLPPIPEAVSLDVSYKLEDSILEVKRQDGLKINPQFYKIPFPANNLLFVVRIKDWHVLDEPKTQADCLVVQPPKGGKTITVFFSLLGTNGQPFAPTGYNPQKGSIITANLPHKKVNQICVGIYEDEDDNEPYNLLVKIPADVLK